MDVKLEGLIIGRHHWSKKHSIKNLIKKKQKIPYWGSPELKSKLF